MKKPAGNQRVFFLLPAAPRSLGSGFGYQMGTNLSANLHGQPAFEIGLAAALIRP
jgi:hypothetical protein